MTFEPRTVLEFFAGIGLARMGLERVGWRVVFANDIDSRKKSMHEGHWGPDPSYVLGSVFDLKAEQIPAAEMAWASFPCVDLSLAGNRAGLRGRSSSAYWGFQDLLATLQQSRPPLVVLENVPGMLTSHGGRDLAEIVAALNKLGYTTDIVMVNAEHFVPQSRARIFVIGVAAPYSLTRGVPTASEIRPQRVVNFMQANPDLDWGATPRAKPPARAGTLSDVLERFPEESDIWWKAESTSRLLGQMPCRHAEKVRLLKEIAGTSFATVYRRVRPTGYVAEARFDGVAGCLRTPRGGSSRQFVLELGKGRARARHMTAVEYGRLQGASGFKITVPEIQAMYGFGDAVCVPAVAWLIRNCVEPIRSGCLTQPTLL